MFSTGSSPVIGLWLLWQTVMISRKNDSDVETKYTELNWFSLQAFCFLTAAEIFAWGSHDEKNTPGKSTSKAFLGEETFFQSSFDKSTHIDQNPSDLSSGATGPPFSAS